MKLIVLMLLAYSTQAFSLAAKNCNSEEFATLDLAHTTAKSYIDKAHQIIQNNDDALISAGLKKYFNVDYHAASDQKNVAFIKNIMNRLWSKVGKVKYKCASDAGLYCSPGILALVPPLSRIQVCPSYFNRTFDKQVGTLIHEWGHRWGFFRLKYVFEKYCTETSGAAASVLIKQPDSYMLFTYFLATNGVGINCFKVLEG
jgi:hypothetical protein